MSSTRWCRSPTCSATSTRCARCHRGAPPSRCNSITTSKCQATSRRKSRRNTPELLALNENLLFERLETRTGERHGEREIPAQQAALQYRHHWSRRPWQDVADGG